MGLLDSLAKNALGGMLGGFGGLANAGTAASAAGGLGGGLHGGAAGGALSGGAYHGGEAGSALGFSESLGMKQERLRAEAHASESAAGRAPGATFGHTVAASVALDAGPTATRVREAAVTAREEVVSLMSKRVAQLEKSLGVTLLKVGGFVAFMLIVGRRLFPWLLWHVAKTGSRELFTLCVVAAAVSVVPAMAVSARRPPSPGCMPRRSWASKPLC